MNQTGKPLAVAGALLDSEPRDSVLLDRWERELTDPANAELIRDMSSVATRFGFDARRLTNDERAVMRRLWFRARDASLPLLPDEPELADLLELDLEE